MTDRLRIAFVCPYPAGAVLPAAEIRPHYRGREHAAPWVRSLSAALARRGDVELRLFVDTCSVRRRHRVVRDGVDLTFIPKWEPYRTDPYHGHWPGTFRLRRALAPFSPDLVQGFGTEGSHGVIASRMPYPNVVFIQGIVAKNAVHHGFTPARRALLEALEQNTARRTDALIAETSFARDWALHVRPDALVRIIPHSSTPAFFAARPTFAEPRVLAIGSLFPIKGVDTAIRALALCQHRHARLVLVGDGRARKSLASLAASLGMAERVEFLGILEAEAVIREMERSVALVIASRVDTSPNVITEAHAAGLPVIGTAVGGIPDMIEEGVDGFLVPVNTPEAIAARMDELLADPARARQLGERGREKVKTLNDPDRIAAEHLHLYSEVIARHGNRGRS